MRVYLFIGNFQPYYAFFRFGEVRGHVTCKEPPNFKTCLQFVVGKLLLWEG